MVWVQEVGEEADGAWGASQEVEGGDIGDGGDLDDPVDLQQEQERLG